MLNADATPRLTPAQFESHLCGATDILRRRIASAEYKHGIDDVSHARGDTLCDPCHLLPGGQGLMTFTASWPTRPSPSRTRATSSRARPDRWARDRYSCLPGSYDDLAFVQYMIASLSSNGMLGVILPHGIFFSGRRRGVRHAEGPEHSLRGRSDAAARRNPTVTHTNSDAPYSICLLSL